MGDRHVYRGHGRHRRSHPRGHLIVVLRGSGLRPLLWGCLACHRADGRGRGPFRRKLRIRWTHNSPYVELYRKLALPRGVQGSLRVEQDFGRGCPRPKSGTSGFFRSFSLCEVPLLAVDRGWTCVEGVTGVAGFGHPEGLRPRVQSTGRYRRDTRWVWNRSDPRPSARHTPPGHEVDRSGPGSSGAAQGKGRFPCVRRVQPFGGNRPVFLQRRWVTPARAGRDRPEWMVWSAIHKESRLITTHRSSTPFFNTLGPEGRSTPRSPSTSARTRGARVNRCAAPQLPPVRGVEWYPRPRSEGPRGRGQEMRPPVRS